MDDDQRILADLRCKLALETDQAVFEATYAEWIGSGIATPQTDYREYVAKRILMPAYVRGVHALACAAGN